MHNDMSGFIIVWCHHLHNQGGTWVHVPSVVVRVKFFKSSRFGSVTTGYDTTTEIPVCMVYCMSMNCMR